MSRGDEIAHLSWVIGTPATGPMPTALVAALEPLVTVGAYWAMGWREQKAVIDDLWARGLHEHLATLLDVRNDPYPRPPIRLVLTDDEEYFRRNADRDEEHAHGSLYWRCAR